MRGERAAGAFRNLATLRPLMTESIEEWLTRVNLQKYAPAFQEHEILFEDLHLLAEADLKELGLSIGARKRFLRALGSIYSAPLIASAPEAASASVAAERRQVAILFADLAGYTRLSTRLDPEELQDVISEFFGIVDNAIIELGGTIDKHLGDGVMALFGAPTAHGDDSFRALRAAMEIQRRLAERNETSSEALLVHIGIASGEVLAGAETGEYTVIGDAVNLASRLSDIAEAEQTFISDEIYSECIDLVNAEAVHNLSIKGIDGTITAWRIIALAQRSEASGRLPFVGREAEKAQFAALLRSIASYGTGAAVLLRGEAGIGKSSLVRRFVELAGENEFVAHSALVLDFGVEEGMDPMRVIFRSLLKIDASADSSTRTSALETFLEFYEDDQVLKPFAKELLEIPLSPAEVESLRALDAASRVHRRREPIIDLLLRLSAQVPQLVVVEDLHWADNAELEFLSALCKAVNESRCMVLLTSRPETTSGLSQTISELDAVQTINLRPLSSREIDSLVASLELTCSRQIVDRLSKAGGNPLFLEQILRHSANDETNELPGGLRSVIQARIDKLPDRERQAIQAASVLGQRFSPLALCHLLNQQSFDPSLLVQQSILQTHSDEFLFSHALVRDVAYASILKTRAAAMHALAGNWFAERDLNLAANHYASAGDDRAASTYVSAGRQQLDRLQFEQADQLTELAKTAPGFGDAVAYDYWLLNGEIRRALGDMDISVEAFQSALKLATSERQELDCWFGIARSCHDRPGEPMSVLKIALRHIFELAESVGSDEDLVTAHHLQSALCQIEGDTTGIFKHAGKAVEIARTLHKPAMLARAMHSLSIAEYLNGLFLSARATLRDTLAVCLESELRTSEVECYHKLGITQFYALNPAECISLSRRTIEQGGELGMLRSVALAHEFIARAALEIGDFELAKSSAYQSLVRSRQLGLKARESIALIHLSRAEMLLKEKESAATADEAVTLARRGGEGFILPWALANRGQMQCEPDQRKADFNEAEELLLGRHCARHNHIHSRIIQMECAIDEEDWIALDEMTCSLQNATQSEPLPLTDFFIRRARTISPNSEWPSSESRAAELIDLRNVKKTTGLIADLPKD